MNTAAAFKPMKPREVDTPKGAVSELFAQAGGLKMVQNRLGIGKSLAYAYTDVQAPEEISFARVAALTSPTTTAAAEFLAFMAGGVFQPIEDAHAFDGVALTAIANQTRDHGAAIASIINAIADGRVSPAEREQVLPLIDAAIRGLTQLRAGVIAAADQV